MFFKVLVSENENLQWLPPLDVPPNAYTALLGQRPNHYHIKNHL